MRSRILGAGAALAVAGLVLAGCSGTPDDGGAASGEQPSGTLTMASWHWLEQGRGDQIYSIVSQYQDDNPNAKIEKQEVTRADFERTLSTEFGAGGGPDIFIIPDTYFPELADAGLLEPLNGVLAAEDEARLLDANEQYLVDGEQLAYVWEVSPYGFFWNPAILEQAGVEVPTTPDELIAAAKQVTQATGLTGFAVRSQMNEEAVWYLDHSNWIFGFGGAWSDGEKLTINSPENIKAETYYQEMYNSGAFAVGDDASTFRAKFGQGQIAMTIDCLTCMRTVTRDNTVVPSTSVGGSLLPFPADSFTRVTVGFGVNANSDNVALAKDFMRWFYTEEVQSQLLQANFPSTVGTDVEVPADLLQANPWAEQTLANIDKSQSALIAGFEVETPQIRTIIMTQIERMLTTGISPKEALDEAQRQAEALVG